mmetsp:Transcript_59576/g.122090  ORF Transcript_59576/g.122090 Transcript_59576/m.122090 type:complete len:487 (-) Transcript_59576:925-2385(-)
MHVDILHAVVPVGPAIARGGSLLVVALGAARGVRGLEVDGTPSLVGRVDVRAAHVRHLHAAQVAWLVLPGHLAVAALGGDDLLLLRSEEAGGVANTLVPVGPPPSALALVRLPIHERVVPAVLLVHGAPRVVRVETLASVLGGELVAGLSGGDLPREHAGASVLRAHKRHGVRQDALLEVILDLVRLLFLGADVPFGPSILAMAHAGVRILRRSAALEAIHRTPGSAGAVDVGAPAVHQVMPNVLGLVRPRITARASLYGLLRLGLRRKVARRLANAAVPVRPRQVRIVLSGFGVAASPARALRRAPVLVLPAQRRARGEHHLAFPAHVLRVELKRQPACAPALRAHLDLGVRKHSRHRLSRLLHTCVIPLPPKPSLALERALVVALGAAVWVVRVDSAPGLARGADVRALCVLNGLAVKLLGVKLEGEQAAASVFGHEWGPKELLQRLPRLLLAANVLDGKPEPVAQHLGFLRLVVRLRQHPLGV